MSRIKEIIARTEIPNTEASLRTGFTLLGVNAGDVLIVHASLSSLGWTMGGERSLIDALIGVVGENGTVVMPAMTGDNSDPGNWVNPMVPNDWFESICREWPAFDREKSPTLGMGRTAELFRTYPKARRSNHPQLSFSAIGKYSSQIVETHVLTPGFGMDSPLGALYRLNARILLIGVSYGRCTALHLSEVLSKRMKTTRSGAAVMKDGKREWIWYDEPDWDSGDFERIGAEFEEDTELVIRSPIGNADCRLLPFRALVDYGADWMCEFRPKPAF